MGKMDSISRETLEQLVDSLLNISLDYAGADLTLEILRENGFEDETLEAIGLDVEE